MEKPVKEWLVRPYEGTVWRVTTEPPTDETRRWLEYKPVTPSNGTMRGAPGSFIILLLLGLSLGFAGGMAWRGQEVANAGSLVRVKDEERQFSERQLSDIKSSLKINEDPSGARQTDCQAGRARPS